MSAPQPIGGAGVEPQRQGLGRHDPRRVDLTLLDLCAKAWDDPNPTYAAGDCRLYRTELAGWTALVAAGSATPGEDFDEFLADWAVNLTAGWQADASAVLPLLPAASSFGKPLLLAGHSKGGADIQDLAALLVHRGFAVARLVTFEAPAGGLDAAVSALAGVDYAHHGDGVVTAPLGRPHPRPLTWFPDPPLPELPDPFANHHLATAVRPSLIRLLKGTPTDA